MDNNNFHVLIISKNKDFQQRTIEALEKAEITTSSALSKSKALKQITTHKPQVIILDSNFLEKIQQELIQHLHEQSLPSSTHFIVAALGSASYPETDALSYWKTGISYAITIPEITAEVKKIQRMINPEPTQLEKINGLARGSRRPKVSVVIPTLNEAKNLPYLLPFLPMDWIDEVVLVDGRSTDNTIEVARQLMPSIVVIEEKRKGKGIAMQSGFHGSTGDIIITLDADGSNDPREIPRMITALLEGGDMVKGSRFANGGGTNDMTLLRKAGNKGLIMLTNVLFSSAFTDLCYGYHAFWRYCLDYLDIEDQVGFEIDTGMYIQAWRNHLRLVETPSFEGYRFHGYGKLQTFKDGWRVLKQIIREKRSQMKASPREDYMGFRGAKPTLLHAPAYKNPFDDFYNSSNFFLQNELAEFQGESKINPVIFEKTRSLFQILYLASKIDYLDLEKLMSHILKQVVMILEAPSGSIIVLDENGAPPKSYNIYNNQVFPVNSDQLYDTLENGLAGWVVKNQQPVILDDTSEDFRWVKRSWEETEAQSRSALSIPLRTENSVVGVLTVTRPQVRMFTPDDLKIANSMIV